MSSFLFLTFCVYVFCCLGLHFSAVPVPNSFLRQLFTCAAQTSTGAPHSFNRAGLGLRWCRSPTWLSKPHTALHRASCGFLCPKTRLPLPLKGEGLGIVFLGFDEFALLVQNWVTLAQQGLFGASLVSFLYPALKTAHRATQGRVWFFSLERGYPSP